MANNTDIKTMIIKRETMKVERDALGVNPDDLMKNPMSALSKMGDIQKAGELSKEIESLADQITQWAVETINQQDQAVLENG